MNDLEHSRKQLTGLVDKTRPGRKRTEDPKMEVSGMKTFPLSVVTLATLAACELAGQTDNYTTIVDVAWVVSSTDGTGGMSYFSDPQWTNYPSRFYRLRSP